MKKKHLLISSFLLLGGMVSGIMAQKGAVASGGEASGSGGTVSYSVGQIDYTTASGSGSIANAGMQQHFEIFITSGLETKGIDLSLSLYPNPTFNEVYLKITDRDLQNLSYSIMDESGRLIAKENINQNMSTIAMQAYAQGVYTINVLESKSIIKSFKLFKN
jgi:Secretion system C-terminal sorting domain